MNSFRAIKLAVLFVLAGVLVSACQGGGESADGDGAEEDGRQVRWGVATTTFGPGQSPYTSLPQALGYWEDEGLDVEVLSFDGSGLTAQAVEAGQVDAGLASPSVVIPAINEGADVIAFFNQITGNIFVPHVPMDSSIRTVDDFPGSVVGVQGLESSTIPLTKAMMNRAGLDPESVEFVDIGTGAEAVSFVKQGRVDILGLFDTVYGEIENQGVQLRPVATDAYKDLGFIGQAVIAKRQRLEEDRDVMVGLARGVAKAMALAAADPECAIRLHWEVYPETKPAGVSDEAAMDQAIRILEQRNSNTQPVDGVWGGVGDGEIDYLMNFLVDAGLLEEGIDVDDLWTEELLDDINEFDEETVVSTAC